MFCAERQFFDSPLGASYPTDIYTKFHYYRGLRKPYKSGTLFQVPIWYTSSILAIIIKLNYALNS